jgi:phospholipase/lecithinase/hemolysin
VGGREENSELTGKNRNLKYWFWDKAHPTYAAHLRMADWWLKCVREFNLAKEVEHKR